MCVVGKEGMGEVCVCVVGEMGDDGGEGMGDDAGGGMGEVVCMCCGRDGR